jgi:NADH dehydrogenase/NADH:ubiquinone oxidoreductase subunit G
VAIKRWLIPAALVFGLWAAGAAAFAVERPAEAVASVPALAAFHEVIFKIWHEASPKKDTTMLRQLLPEVDKGIAQVASAQLPAILREREAAWEEGVKKLQSAGSEYKAAAMAKDDARLLAAAERLHSQFEALMRVTRPALKELDDFHAVLYMLYHHYLPDKDMQKIRSSAIELKQAMMALNAVQLPERLKQREPEFQEARNKLSRSVDDLAASLQTKAEPKIQAAVNELHSNYQALERVFE